MPDERNDGMRRLLVTGAGRMANLVAETAASAGWGVVGCFGLGQEDEGMTAAHEAASAGGLDAIVDFSAPTAMSWVAPLASECGAALVSGTTGLGDAERALLDEAARTVPVCWSSNYSVGVAVAAHVVREMAQVLSGDWADGALDDAWECEIVERHHDAKVDAPSGTALSLADAVDPEGHLRRVCGRSGMCPRQHDELGICSVRGGTMAGTHEVGFYGSHEQLLVTHVAEDRSIFAVGAVHAADLLAGRAAGRYEFADLLFGSAEGSKA